MLKDVIGFVLFFTLLFALIGLISFKGVFSRRCYAINNISGERKDKDLFLMVMVTQGAAYSFFFFKKKSIVYRNHCRSAIILFWVL